MRERMTMKLKKGDVVQFMKDDSYISTCFKPFEKAVVSTVQDSGSVTFDSHKFKPHYRDEFSHRSWKMFSIIVSDDEFDNLLRVVFPKGNKKIRGKKRKSKTWKKERV